MSKLLMITSLLALASCGFKVSLIGQWSHTVSSHLDSTLDVSYEGTYTETEKSGCSYHGVWQSEDGSGYALLTIEDATAACHFPTCATYSVTFNYSVTSDWVINITNTKYTCVH